MTTIILSISGMSCGNCVRHVEGALKKLPGVAAVEVELSSGRATVEYDATAVTPDVLKKAVADAGYTAAID